MTLTIRVIVIFRLTVTMTKKCLCDVCDECWWHSGISNKGDKDIDNDSNYDEVTIKAF